MKTQILGLRTVIYRVPDLNAAKQWYAQAFGLEPYFDEPFYVGFNVGGYELGLQPHEATTGSNILTYWGVEDMDMVYKKFLGLGAGIHEAPQNVGGEITVASLKDPWGNIIGLIYNPEFKLPE